MLLGMPWRSRAPPIVNLRLRIHGRVCHPHRTLSVVHRATSMTQCVCLACPTNARPGGVGTSRTRPIRSETYSSLRVIYVLDGVVADTALCSEQIVVCTACYMYTKHVHDDERWLHAGEGLELEDRFALATMEYVLSRAAGFFSPAHLSCLLRAVLAQLQSAPVSAQAPPPDFVTGLLALAELLLGSTCPTAGQMPNFGELNRLLMMVNKAGGRGEGYSYLKRNIEF